MWDPMQEKVWKPRVLLFFDFSACRCQKKSIVYETECKRVAVQASRTRTVYTIALNHIQATLYLVCSEMGSQCSFSGKGVECLWQGAKRTSPTAKFRISSSGEDG